MQFTYSLACLIRSRIHAAPPKRLHFSHSSSVIRTGRLLIVSPVLLSGLRPWPRSFGGRFVFSMRQ